MRRRVLDVSPLPTHAFGARDPMWWGMVMFAAIEGTMLVLLAVSYYYVRERIGPWPPNLTPKWIAWLATGEVALMLASIAPMLRANRGAYEGSVAKMRWGLIGANGFAIAALVCRYIIFQALPFTWDVNAYASVVWMLLGLQTFHLVTGIAENFFFIVLFFKGPVEEKHRIDVEVGTILWWFVIAGNLLLWAVVFLEILLTRRTV